MSRTVDARSLAMTIVEAASTRTALLTARRIHADNPAVGGADGYRVSDYRLIAREHVAARNAEGRLKFVLDRSGSQYGSAAFRLVDMIVKANREPDMDRLERTCATILGHELEPVAPVRAKPGRLRDAQGRFVRIAA